MGVLDTLVDLLDVSVTRKKRKLMQTVEIKVKMDCDGCERRVRNAVSSMKGVRSVEINRKQSRVMVEGNVEAREVLEKVKSLGKKKAELWPYVPCNVVPYPYEPQIYDKSAPTGHKSGTRLKPSPARPTTGTPLCSAMRTPMPVRSCNPGSFVFVVIRRV